MKTDQPTYHADSNIRFTLTAKNTTQQEMLLRFNSGQRYDFELIRGKDAKGMRLFKANAELDGPILTKPESDKDSAYITSASVNGFSVVSMS